MGNKRRKEQLLLHGAAILNCKLKVVEAPPGFFKQKIPTSGSNFVDISSGVLGKYILKIIMEHDYNSMPAHHTKSWHHQVRKQARKDVGAIITVV